MDRRGSKRSASAAEAGASSNIKESGPDKDADLLKMKMV
jgi:hypothetical protein